MILIFASEQNPDLRPALHLILPIPYISIPSILKDI